LRKEGDAARFKIRAASPFSPRLPSLDRQRQVVAYLDGLREKGEELSRIQTAASEELQAVMPAILDRAFKGEL
jgi:type I restriction enzyme, S subunit